MSDNTILYHITEDQAELLCNHYNKNISELEDYEICELLDKFISDNLS